MTYYSRVASKPSRVTTYPGRGPDGSDRRYIVGPVAEAAALRDQTLTANKGAKVVWEQIDHGLDCARYEILVPSEESN